MKIYFVIDKMVSTLNLDEKYNRVRRNFCFYLDIQDHGLARSISRRIQDIGLQQEVFLTSRVSHVIRDRAGGSAGGAGTALPARCRREGRRADAMLDRVRRADPITHSNEKHHKYVTLTVHKAINLLDKLYDTFFTASRKSHVRLFTKHFIKIEFLDKLCRPIYKEFDEWPSICLDPDPPKDKREKKESPENLIATNQIRKITAGQKMTRKSRPRVKERHEKEPVGGYCEMCNSEYMDAVSHRRSAHHLAFVRDTNNFLALDSLISSGADVSTFLDKATPVNGERRSQRNMCNGDLESKSKRAKRSQSPDSTVNGQSPRRNGGLEDERKHNTRCSKKAEEDRQYYKVVGVSTKLRSSGGFTKRKDSPPTVNGAKPLVVKFRKVRRSELSVLSDEAEQFMFPKRASSASSTSSDDDDDKVLSPKRKSPARPAQPPATMERRRLAKPLALKEESSEEDSWPEDTRRRKRRGPAVVKRARRVPCKTIALELPVESDPVPATTPTPVPTETPVAPVETPQELVSPLREEVEKCMKWEDGRLKYTPAVEQLEFAFESVPHSEPWYETFKRQDQDKVVARNVPRYFALYSTASPKLPYEIGQLPPLKPNCCPLSDLVKQREEKPGPSRSYGTRGMKKQKIRKRTAAVIALEGHSRKSPREHASTLAILGSAGLLNRRKLADDNKSTASEDTVSDTHSNMKLEPLPSESREASDRLQRFLTEVFSDADELDMCEETLEGDAAVTPAHNLPDVSSLFSECDGCDIIRNEMREATAESRPRVRRGRFKKKNKTGWPNKKKQKKSSRTNSSESEHKTETEETLERFSAEPVEDDNTRDTLSELDTNASETEMEKTVIEKYKSEEESRDADDKTLTEDTMSESIDADSSDKLLIDLKVLVDDDKSQTKQEKEERNARSSTSSEDRELRKKRRALQGLCDWLPVVRVARVDPTATRRLRSAGRARSNRLR